MTRYCDTLSRQCRVVFRGTGETTMPGPEELKPLTPTLRVLMTTAAEYDSLDSELTTASDFVTWLSLELQLHGFTFTEPPARRSFTELDKRRQQIKREKRRHRAGAA